MNNNKGEFNKLLNHFKEVTPKLSSNNTYTIFFVIIIFVIVVLLIIIVRRNFNLKKQLSKEIKNTFFLEMLQFKSPYNAWDENSKICIRGKKNKVHKIPSDKLGPRISDSYTLMFWVKINTNKFENNINSDLNYPLVALTNNNTFNMCSDGGKNMFPGFFIKPINNTLVVQMSDDTNCHESEVYNFPYDEWTCVTTYVTKNYIEIFINGKLLKTSELDSLNIISPENLDMYIGRYPGLLAFLSININPYYNSNEIYKEYLYYKNIIDIYEQSKYKHEYNYDRKQNPHKYKSFNRDFIKKKKVDPNVCS